jgi:molybdate transport system substrate-binding protein
MKMGLLLVMAIAVSVNASEIKVLSVTATGLMAMMEQLAPEFERATGHKVTVAFGLGPDLRKRIDDGETFDVIIQVPSVIDELTQQGKVAAGMRTDFARTGIGVCVRAGKPKPNIGSVEAFKRTLLNAKSITYNPAVLSGRHVANLLQKLGISEEMRAKTVSAENKPGPEKVAGVVARGEAELGLVITTDIISGDGVEYVGPLPKELQTYIVFTAAVSKSAKDPDAAKALIDFLKTPAAASVIKAKGMERPE